MLTFELPRIVVEMAVNMKMAASLRLRHFQPAAFENDFQRPLVSEACRHFQMQHFHPYGSQHR